MMQSCNRYEITKNVMIGSVVACAGYVGAWIAAGPASALSDPRAGALMALAGVITYALTRKQVFNWASQQFPDNENKAFSVVLFVSFTGALLTARMFGFAVDPTDITVLTLGVLMGTPVAVVGLCIGFALLNRVRNLTSRNENAG